ncbi:MAG: bifunctional DNA-formamidopyrimidine glycosylase/DNA-(apurinic or apyrimidinic site) lyase [Chloroflexota bacterium]
MPELPEVETMVRDLSARVVDRVIDDVSVSNAASVRWPTFQEFRRRLLGRAIVDVWRRGKYAVLTLDSSDLLIIHRGMSGSVLLREKEAPLEAHVRAVFTLDTGDEMRFNDPRKFGKIFLIDRRGEEHPLPWAHLGMEPLDDSFSADTLASLLAGRKALLKPLLLDQRLVAGLGNIYVDEVLHRASLHPQRRAHSLTVDEVQRLHGAIRWVLATAVHQRGTTFESYRDIEGREGHYQDVLLVFRRTGSACRRCGTAIVKIVVGGRGTHFCPTCQRAS